MLPPLSNRQREVAYLICRGNTDKEIACSLGISESTVGAHVKGIFAKLGIHKRAQMVSHQGKFKRPDNTPSFIYFLLCREIKRIKIGVTENPDIPLQRHFASCPYPLEVLAVVRGTRALERNVHKRFEHIRKHMEWFDATAELKRFIHSLTNTKPNTNVSVVRTH